MRVINKVFGATEMTWKRVIFISLISGIVIGLLMIPKFLEGTSIQQPGISYEFWILFALYIILNCKKPLEAGLKTFVAFVISQPVIYLVQVPFSWLHWQIMDYYPTWIIPTILTFPGAMLGWYVKKGNLLSVFILSIANLILCVELPSAVLLMLKVFPKQSLSVIFIISEILFFIFYLFKGKMEKTAAFVLAALMLISASVYEFNSRVNGSSAMKIQLEDPAPYELVSDNELFDISFDDDYMVIIYNPYKLKDDGSDIVSYKDADGNVHEIKLMYGSGDVYTDD